MLDEVDCTKTTLSQFVNDSEVLVWVSSFNLVADAAHPLVKGRFIQHFGKTRRSTKINRHEKFKRGFLNLLVVNMHLSDEPLPFEREPDEPEFGLLIELYFILFLQFWNFNDILKFLWVQFLDLVEKVILLDLIWVLVVCTNLLFFDLRL